jgi:hypothetical protein
VNTLLQVVPALPPVMEGVGGYALTLADHLRTQGIETIFACRSDCEVAYQVVGLTKLPTGLPTLLHYANYGYEPHGLPVDVVAAIEAQATTAPLSTFFHEFIATGPPWRRPFWTATRQRALVRRLARSSRVGFTTIPVYGQSLSRIAPDLPLRVLAMPSPVGEPETVQPPSSRRPVGLVFGGPGARSSIYRRLDGLGRNLALTSAIDRLIDIGPRPELAPRSVGDVTVEAIGVVSAPGVSTLLLEGRLGFISYPADFCGKSTAFAAQAAHGVPCLALAAAKFLPADAPSLSTRTPFTLERLDLVASKARDWYSSHGIAAHARAIVAALFA